MIALVRSIRSIMPKIGTRKLYYILKDKLIVLNVGRDKLFRILKGNHMLIKPKRSYQITIDSHHRFRKHKNIVCNVEINRPEQVWVSDITYLGSRSNPSYLALITDAYFKKIIGYNVSESLAVDGTIKALEMALNYRMYKDEPLIHHSDRGLQYCSNEYQNLLSQNAIKSSMTEKYDPYENTFTVVTYEEKIGRTSYLHLQQLKATLIKPHVNTRAYASAKQNHNETIQIKKSH